MNSKLAHFSSDKLRNVSNLLTSALSSYLVVLFLWLLSVLACAVGSVSEFEPNSLTFFIVANITLLTGAAIVSASCAKMPRVLTTINFIVYSLMVFCTAFSFIPLSDERLVLVNLFFILIIAIPALSDLWSWPLQLVAGLLAVTAAVVMWMPIGGWPAINSILSVAVAAALSATVSFIHFPRKSSDKSKTEAAQREMLLSIAAERFSNKTSGMLLLQANLLLVLFFFDSLAATNGPAFVTTPFAYAFMLFVFEMLLLSIVKRRYLPATAIAFTVAIATVVLAMQSPAEAGPLRRVLPAVYLAWSAAILPWSTAHQIALAWILTLLGAFATLFTALSSGVAWNQLIYSRFILDGNELALLICGVGSSVLMARVSQERTFTRFSQFVADETAAVTTEGEVSAGAVKTLPASSRSILKARTKHLIVGLVFLGIVSCCVSTLSFSVYGNASVLEMSTPWLGFALLWTVLFYAATREQGLDKVWFYGVTVALIALVFTAIILLRHHVSPSFWVLWPFCVLLAMSLIPWGAIELSTLVVIASLISLEILIDTKSSTLIPVHLGTLLLGTLFSLRASRYLKEKHLLFNYPMTLSNTKNEVDILHVLADYLSSLFQSNFALILKADQSSSLVVNGAAYELPSANRFLPRLEQQFAADGEVNERVRIKVLNWLPITVELFDRRIGMHMAHHGIAILISGQAAPKDPAIPTTAEHEGASAKQTLIFLGSRLPLLPRLKQTEIEIARALTHSALLRAEIFDERDKNQENIKHFQAAQTEREYELGTLVHDINNTVQDLTLLCEMILDKENAEARDGDSADGGTEGQIKRIAVIARSMATVVSDAKRKRELERLSDLTPREAVEVVETLREIALFAKVRAERKRISVRTYGLDDEAVWVKVSAREHLETIVRNLLNNAIMYSNAGAEIIVSLRTDERKVYIDIGDNGPGLSQEEQKVIFIPGYRGQKGASLNGGLGLGLWQSRRVAESAGGSLEVHSPGAGRGSTFTVSLPRQKHLEKVQAVNETGWALMVDDQPALTDFYARIAKALRLNPIVASSVPDAIAILEDKGVPRFVLTDLHMGNTYGLDLVRYVRENFGQSIPVLVVSGITDEDIEQRARKAGATDFVAKPIGRQALFARIQSLLSEF